MLKTEITKLEEKEQHNLHAVKAATNNDVSRMDRDFSEDYLAVSRALAVLENSGPRVRTIQYFLLVSFIFIGTLIILLKAATAPGEYKAVRDFSCSKCDSPRRQNQRAIQAWDHHGPAERRRNDPATRLDQDASKWGL